VDEGRPVDDVRDGRFPKLHDDKGAWHARVSANIERDHLNRDVGQIREVQQVTKLRPHDLGPSNLPSQRSLLLVEHLSMDWGSYVVDGSEGKIVWATIQGSFDDRSNSFSYRDE
jgi:hypothetical protein